MSTKLSDDAVLWRYMDFSELINLLYRKQLWFTSVLELHKEDTFEGMSEEFFDIIRERPSIQFNKFNSQEEIEATKLAKLNLLKEKKIKAMMGTTFVNCWYISDYESAAMWNVHSGNKKTGIAIKTTYKKLKNCFQNSDHFEIRKVKYNKPRVFPKTTEEAFYNKIAAYKFEQELRCIYTDENTQKNMIETVELWNKKVENNPDIRLEIREEYKKGLYLPRFANKVIDFNEFLDAIVASPFASGFLVETINDVLRKYNLKILTFKSDMRTDFLGEESGG